MGHLMKNVYILKLPENVLVESFTISKHIKSILYIRPFLCASPCLALVNFIKTFPFRYILSEI